MWPLVNRSQPSCLPFYSTSDFIFQQPLLTTNMAAEDTPLHSPDYSIATPVLSYSLFAADLTLALPLL